MFRPTIAQESGRPPAENAIGSKYWSGPPRIGLVEYPGTRLGRCEKVRDRTLALSNPMSTENGEPEASEAMPFTCQPPSRARATPAARCPRADRGEVGREVVPDVEVGQPALGLRIVVVLRQVALEVGLADVGGTVVDRLAQRVGRAEHHAIGEPLVHLHPQPVVERLALGDAIPAATEVDIALAPGGSGSTSSPSSRMSGMTVLPSISSTWLNPRLPT